MKQFLIKVLITLFTTLIFAVAVDAMLDFLFINYHKRSKTDIKNQKANVVFFGSSRCVHHIVPSLYDSLNSTTSFNMGWAASDPREIYAAVKLYLKFNEVPKKIFLQLDLEAEKTGVDELATQGLIKHFHRNLIDDYYTEEQNLKYQWPLYPNMFYRDYSWRELLKTVFKNQDRTQNKGYIPLYRTFKNNIKSEDSNSVPIQFMEKENPWILKTIELCKSNGIQVTLFTSPYFKVLYPERFSRFSKYNCCYFNLSKSLSDSIYFSDNSHLSHLGAREFTKILSDSAKHCN